jgi:hypothetical protein
VSGITFIRYAQNRKIGYIYIGIAIVAGFGLLIVILILTVIHLDRRNRKGHGMCLTRAIQSVL